MHNKAASIDRNIKLSSSVIFPHPNLSEKYPLKDAAKIIKHTYRMKLLNMTFNGSSAELINHNSYIVLYYKFS